MNEQAMLIPDKWLEACQEIEMITSKIYHFHADHFANNEKMSRFWRKTAFEEEKHSLQVDISTKSMLSISEAGFDVCRMESIRNLIHALFEAIKRSPPVLEEAIQISIELEEILARFHMDNAIFCEENGGTDLFRILMMHDLEQINELECALKELYSDKSMQFDKLPAK